MGVPPTTIKDDFTQSSLILNLKARQRSEIRNIAQVMKPRNSTNLQVVDFVLFDFLNILSSSKQNSKVLQLLQSVYKM